MSDSHARCQPVIASGDPECTDCGGSGVTYQTERKCSCAAGAEVLERCPTCNSPDPARHPAVQFEGEVEICRDPWHAPRPPAGDDEAIPLADHDEIGRKVLGQPWAIQAAIVTITAHCTVLTDKHPTGDVADLAGCISQQCLELANALAKAAPHAGSGVLTGDARIAERLTDVVMMLDTPDAYARPYVAAVCRSILSSLLPSAHCEGGRDDV